SADGADQFYGGGGVDIADYSHRGGPQLVSLGVNVSLDGHTNDGGSSENDFISGDVEVITGTVGKDTLIGNSLANTLNGIAGNDDLAGGGGADVLDGGSGDDTLRDDLDATADTFTCGPGADQAFLDLKGVFPGSDCENVVQSAIDSHPNVAIGVGKVVRID